MSSAFEFNQYVLKRFSMDAAKRLDRASDSPRLKVGKNNFFINHVIARAMFFRPKQSPAKLEIAASQEQERSSQ
jgi:hypothetical protein